MKLQASEKGQALILITLAAVGLFAFAALAIDGSMLFSDRRHAQNAADTSAMAGALAHARGNTIDEAALTRALSNGYDDNGTTNEVTVEIVDSPPGVCPVNTVGKDITVTIVSTINTTFARVIGRNQLTNIVTATSRACGTYTGPPFPGNAIIALAPSGQGYDGSGNADWIIQGGGIFSNSSDPDAAYCNGNIDIEMPSLTVVGNYDWRGGCNPNITGSIIDDADQLTYSNYEAYFPRQPACNGTAFLSGGQYHPQAGADGSSVAFLSNSDMDFAPGLYCVTNDNINVHGLITGINVTFYMPSPNFSLTFNGGGALGFPASAPTSGEYDGVLIYLAPQFDANGNLIQTQDLQLLGNGNGDITGTVIAPSASVIMRGNSGSDFNTQIIAWDVTSNGTSDVVIVYDPDDNLHATLPITLTLLR
jgi:Flp pilus assembly protein TadG